MTDDKMAALIDLCAATVERERLSDEDIEADRKANGEAKEDEAYNSAIRHAADSVRWLLTQTLHWRDGKWVLLR